MRSESEVAGGRMRIMERRCTAHSLPNYSKLVKRIKSQINAAPTRLKKQKGSELKRNSRWDHQFHSSGVDMSTSSHLWSFMSRACFRLR